MCRHIRIAPFHACKFATRVFLIATLVMTNTAFAANATRLTYAGLGSGGNACCLVPDRSGNYYVIGSAARQYGDTDVSIIKVDPGGHVMSSFSFGGGAIDSASGAAMDSAGNLVI